MKTSTIKSIFICIFFAVAFNIEAQQRITIRLNVNTAQITRNTISQNANFGQNSTISNEDYTITANVGDTIVWEGVTSIPGHRVSIEQINHQGGVRVFNRNALNGRNGVVMGIIADTDSRKSGQDKGIRRGDTEKYVIRFRVFRNDNETQLNGILQIDPKITIKQ